MSSLLVWLCTSLVPWGRLRFKLASGLGVAGTSQYPQETLPAARPDRRHSDATTTKCASCSLGCSWEASTAAVRSK